MIVGLTEMGHTPQIWNCLIGTMIDHDRPYGMTMARFSWKRSRVSWSKSLRSFNVFEMYRYGFWTLEVIVLSDIIVSSVDVQPSITSSLVLFWQQAAWYSRGRCHLLSHMGYTMLLGCYSTKNIPIHPDTVTTSKPGQLDEKCWPCWNPLCSEIARPKIHKL